MIFVDTNVFMYAVGRDHVLKGPARSFLTEAQANHDQLCCSAEGKRPVNDVFPFTRFFTGTDSFLRFLLAPGIYQEQSHSHSREADYLIPFLMRCPVIL